MSAVLIMVAVIKFVSMKWEAIIVNVGMDTPLALTVIPALVRLMYSFINLLLLFKIDNNECSTGNGGCEHNCTNTPGSYNCSCANGYSLNGDHHGCSR